VIAFPQGKCVNACWTLFEHSSVDHKYVEYRNITALTEEFIALENSTSVYEAFSLLKK